MCAAETGSSTDTATRWHRDLGRGVRLLAGVGPPLAVAFTALLGWASMDASTGGCDTRHGIDGSTSSVDCFVVPVAIIVICGGAALVGLTVLTTTTAGAAARSSVVFWLATGWLFLAPLVSDEVPADEKPTMVVLALASLLPTAIVCGWAAFGPLLPQRPLPR